MEAAALEKRERSQRSRMGDGHPLLATVAFLSPPTASSCRRAPSAVPWPLRPPGQWCGRTKHTLGQDGGLVTIPRGQQGQAGHPRKRVPICQVTHSAGPGTGRVPSTGTRVVWELTQRITLALEKAGTLLLTAGH